LTGRIEGKQKAVWILGLNHSGTTIVWKAFRKDARFLCFDEPLTPDIGLHFPRNNIKLTFDEYINLFGNDPDIFWGLYASIDHLQELDHEFTVEQEHYLRTLLGQADNVVVDETHLHLHLPSIKHISPDDYVVHLYRCASGFVTSHLRPNWSRDGSIQRRVVRWLRHEVDKKLFWSRTDFPPGMRRDDVIGNHPQSKFGLMLAEAGYDSNRIMNSTALVRLLAYWHYHYHYLEREGPKLFGNKFMSLHYENFATSPAESMSDMYEWLNLSLPAGIHYSDVHAPRPPFKLNNPRWTEAARIAGFSVEELETLL